MRVLILAPGGRGDTQPLVALGKKLVDRGHDVIFVCPYSWCDFANSYGLDAVPLTNSHQEIKASPATKLLARLARRGPSAIAILLGTLILLLDFNNIKKRRRYGLDELAKIGSCGADIVVHHVFIPGNVIAEAVGVPAVPVTMVPCWVSTRGFPNPWFPLVPKRLNYASYKVCFPRWGTELGTSQWRRETMGLTAWRGHRNVIRRPKGEQATVFQALSKTMLPSMEGYSDNVHNTGYWFLSAEKGWTPSKTLSSFVSTETKPVCICFGDLTGLDSRRSARTIAEAVLLAGVRAIVVGVGSISQVPLGDDIYYADQIPFDWLFPRVSIVVHHGGMGTAGLALAAGRPQVACPSHPGQEFTAQRLKALGVAGDPLPKRQLTAEALARSIRQAMKDNSMAGCASRAASQVRNEHGLETAVKILESLAWR